MPRAQAAAGAHGGHTTTDRHHGSNVARMPQNRGQAASIRSEVALGTGQGGSGSWAPYTAARSAPFGFQFIDGRREWHQGEQETLAAIIEHRGAGLSWAKVADKLSATGHRTRTGGQWTRQGAHQVHRARERQHGAAA